VDVPEKNVVTFQPGKEMEERVRTDARVYEPKRKKQKGGANNKAKPAPGAQKAKGPPKPGKKAPGGEPVMPPAGTPAPDQELVGVGAHHGERAESGTPE
jgi:hypothetical protein